MIVIPTTKKAQLQMGETIFAVIIIILLIVFGMVFFKEVQEDEMKQKKAEFLDLDTVAISQYTSSLSELQCSVLEVEELSCFDKEKITAFINLTTQHKIMTAEYYFIKMGNAFIRIEEIYPNSHNYTLYNNTLNDSIAHDEEFVIIPISLLDPLEKTYSFGTLYIRKYSRK